MIDQHRLSMILEENLGHVLDLTCHCKYCGSSLYHIADLIAAVRVRKVIPVVCTNYSGPFFNLAAIDLKRNIQLRTELR